MTHRTLLTDELLRHLMAVGQVDIVVGVPTLNNAETIASTVRAADEGLASHFPRQRTVIICADGGSRDGTPGIVQQLSSGAAGRPAAVGGLRTRHHIASSYRGVPGRASAIRLIFAASDLLQARAVAVLDPEVGSLTPAWVDALIGPVAKQSFDLVAPVYGRHPLEGPLLTQLVRPLMRAAYGRQVQEPLMGEFGCSGQFATHCLALDAWEDAPTRDAIELWLMSTALVGFQVCQVVLGSRVLVPVQPPRPGLSEVFPHVVGSLFGSLEAYEMSWLSRQGSVPLPVIGLAEKSSGDAPSLDPARLGESFCQNVRDLRPILESILAADTFAGVWTLSECETADVLRYPDELWIATVYDFLCSHHRGVMDRAHIAQALMPLYMGRVASFLMQHAASEPMAVEQDTERLAQQFERAKPYVIERWNRTT